MLLDNKVAVVTGSSRKIGRSIALILAESGADVVVNYVKDEEAAADVSEQIKDIGRKSLFIKADVTNPKEVQSLISSTVDKLGRIDILVNNVGQFVMKKLVDTSADEWEQMVNTNLSAAFYGCKFACEYMRVQQYGRIVNIGFALSENLAARPDFAAYAIAKAGLVMLTKSLAVEEAGNGIHVNMVSPGIIDTGSIPSKSKEELTELIPVKKLGVPANISQAVLFLLSDDENYLNGSNIVVSGGWSG